MAYVFKTFKPTIFKLMGGLSEVFPTTAQLATRTSLPFYSGVKLKVCLPPQIQLTKYQSNLIKRLNDDWGESLSCLRCSTGDFRRALNDGKVSLGHVWAEIYSISLHKVTLELGFGDIHFSENFQVLIQENNYMVYRILLFFSKQLPEEFGGLEYLVTGYLNAAIEEQPFPIRLRLDDFIAYRSVSVKPAWHKCLADRLLKCFRGG